MKLKLLLGALLAGSLFTSQAQAQSGPHIGFISGYNSTWLIDQKLFDDPNYDSRKTWNSAPYGVALGWKFNPASSVQVEVYKSKMGAEYDILGMPVFGQPTEIVGEKRIETEYWAVPVLYKFTTGDKVRFNFHLGPQFSFLSEGSEINQIDKQTVLRANLATTDLTGADIIAHPNNDPSDPAIKTKSVLYTGPITDIRTPLGKENFSKTDIGAAIGLGMEVDIVGNLYLSANLRFYYGFLDIRSDNWVEMEKDRGYYDSRNNVTGGAQLGLHYRFDL
jgi:opacity protein-like surface antigen